MRLFKNIFVALITAGFVIFIILLSISPGRTRPFKDESGRIIPNSIAVIEHRNIGGVSQGLIIRGIDQRNPVMLYLHGGPGVPSYPMIHEQLKSLEKLFTICYWDQRGAGMSYRGVPSNSLTTAQLVEDIFEITQYLKNKFSKQKIYLFGHSWGTFLGTLAAKKNPELFHAYIGIGQLGNTYESEVTSHEFVVNELMKKKGKKFETLLPSKQASSSEWWDYLKEQRKYVADFGGSMKHKNVSMRMRILSVLNCREYRLSDKLNYAKGVRFSIDHLWKEMLDTDLNVAVPQLQIPVYIFQGRHDQQTDYELARQYFESLQAPLKRFYSFENSAHWPHVEEYDKFESIVKEEIVNPMLNKYAQTGTFYFRRF